MENTSSNWRQLSGFIPIETTSTVRPCWPRAKSRSFYGFFDYTFDTDWYKISLEEGESIEISTDSILADTTIEIRNRETGESAQSDGTNPAYRIGLLQERIPAIHRPRCR